VDILTLQLTPCLHSYTKIPMMYLLQRTGAGALVCLLPCILKQRVMKVSKKEIVASSVDRESHKSLHCKSSKDLYVVYIVLTYGVAQDISCDKAPTSLHNSDTDCLLSKTVSNTRH
jgi:hypothetical protein